MKATWEKHLGYRVDIKKICSSLISVKIIIMNKNKINIVSQEQDYSQWYLDVAHHGKMFEYAPVTGCITFLPKSVTLWNTIRMKMSEKLVAL